MFQQLLPERSDGDENVEEHAIAGTRPDYSERSKLLIHRRDLEALCDQRLFQHLATRFRQLGVQVDMSG